MNFPVRKRKLQQSLAAEKLDALVVTHLPNVLYLCGFTGSAGVLVATSQRWAFFTDGRYARQSEEEVEGARVTIAKGPALTAVAKWLSRTAARRVGVEAEHMPMSVGSALKSMLPSGATLHQTRGTVEKLRLIKEAEEIERMRSAVALGTELLNTAVAAVRPGVRESTVAGEIEFAARRQGAAGMAFDTIVASGLRSALPHGRASSATIPRKGFVVMDYGVILANYCSDMTRTVHVGRISSESRRIYEAVREAQQAGIEAVRAGAEIASVDAAARKVLAKAGYGKYFTHSTGHGVGLEIHEMPRVARGVSGALQTGMVITIEPGAYIADKGGVRIEDMVVVTESGCEVLTHAPKELIEI